MDELAASRPDALDQRLGRDRGAAVREELASHGLVAIDRDELERLVRESAAYARLARLVEDPSAPDA